MKLDPHIKPLPKSFSQLPVLRRYKGLLLLRTVYFQKEIYEDLLTDKPQHEHVGYFVHENIHYKRMKEMGMVQFGLRYLLSRKARFYEEFIAYRAQMKYLKKHNERLDIERVARALSSWVYLWCTSYEQALKELNKK